MGKPLTTDSETGKALMGEGGSNKRKLDTKNPNGGKISHPQAEKK